MKRLASLIMVSILGGVLTLGSYKLFLEEDTQTLLPKTHNSETAYLPVSKSNAIYGTNADFTEAAEKTVHAVVHVKNVAIFKGPRSVWEYYQYGNKSGRALQGSGSGVIITPDGYIVTNNHVIKGASEIEVTLNNNKTYKAEVIGSDATADIALLKIDAKGLDYIPFGNSNNVEIGEWVLAVGNPFNLKSTVTAGIISAKARDLNAGDGTPQSFIQTDAAINPGNSGGALVNVNGELIGINTAITSPSGSYIGYAFAVPSNNARKIVEDILEYGVVQQGILGIRGGSLLNITNQAREKYDINTAQGVFVADVTSGSGAEKAGIKTGDVIRQLDNIQIRNFSDLTGYVNSKRPGDKIAVSVLRNGKGRKVSVELTKYETYKIDAIKMEFANATKEELKQYNVNNGVRIAQLLDDDLPAAELLGAIVVEINNEQVNSIADLKQIMESRNPSGAIVLTYINRNGEKQRIIWK